MPHLDMSRYYFTFDINRLEQLADQLVGRAIEYEDLFGYNNGRFLANEKFQCDRRRVKFDVPALCNVAASVGVSHSPIKAIDKMEGGFSKALLLSKEDGTELVAKMPCPHAGPPGSTTTSEVAVLQYIHQNTTIPVPKVLAWSSDQSNTVGCEYIIMDKAPGIQLFKVWADMTELARLNLIEQLTKWQGELASLRFSAYGHLYPCSSMDEDTKRLPIDADMRAPDEFCIGPSCDRTWMPVAGLEAGFGVQASVLDQGPWKSTSTFGIALARREIDQIQRNSRSLESHHRGTPEEQTSLLHTAIELFKALNSQEVWERHGIPTLWHTDLHMGNIFVSEDDPSQIVCIIDWQQSSISPRFLQCHWPEFLQPPENYPDGLVKPKLPDDFDDLSKEDQELATYTWQRASWTKAYEISTYRHSNDAYKAMTAPKVVRELLLRCGETYEEGAVPLRTCLIEFQKNWNVFGLKGNCPYMFNEYEIKEHEAKFNEYEEYHAVRAFAKEYLDTDAEGWVPPEVDFDTKRQQNRALFEFLVSEHAGEKSRQELLSMWPFPEGL